MIGARPVSAPFLHPFPTGAFRSADESKSTYLPTSDYLLLLGAHSSSILSTRSRRTQLARFSLICSRAPTRARTLVGGSGVVGREKSDLGDIAIRGAFDVPSVATTVFATQVEQPDEHFSTSASRVE